MDGVANVSIERASIGGARVEPMLAGTLPSRRPLCFAVRRAKTVRKQSDAEIVKWMEIQKHREIRGSKSV